ncbi:hypothetical protein Y032_0005g2414 [Ancylostoma ceylanicum]|uniref:SCP domain-containing protein n=1 Tax=Ancylostoma ceylanicum TaxID=53326 RepID=A0A016VTJ7_9BILA|nr:hypothetical protein Y032_0005g2414 [Ancylostoma ceylanicum]
MAKFYFIALAIISVLPALCKGQFCENGELLGDEIYEYVVDPVNERRETLLNGKQQNGDSGKNLPPPKGMTKLYWDCDLEKQAIDILKGKDCFLADDPPTNAGGKAQIFEALDASTTPSASSVIKSVIGFSLSDIDYVALPIQDGATEVKYTDDGKESLLNYFTLTQPSSSKIGCAWKKCTNGQWLNVYCILDSPAIKDGGVIYEVGKAGTCIDCPTGTGCDPTSNLCVPLASLPTTQPGATTTPSTSTTTPTTTTTTTPTTTTTTPPPAPTTTPPTSPEASFPTGASSRCTHAVASRMTDTLRSEYERLHNFRRGLLATGQIPRKDGKYLPTASNMQKISYDCGLEEGAIRWASQCPTTNSAPSSRNGVGENFKTFPATRFTFDTAAKKSVTEWWKPIRDVNYFEKVVVFRPFHDGAPISSFTQVSNMYGSG